MKKSDIVILIAVAAGIVIAWLLDENKSKSEQIEKLQKEIDIAKVTKKYMDLYKDVLKG